MTFAETMWVNVDKSIYSEGSYALSLASTGREQGIIITDISMKSGHFGRNQNDGGSWLHRHKRGWKTSDNGYPFQSHGTGDMADWDLAGKESPSN